MWTSPAETTIKQEQETEELSNNVMSLIEKITQKRKSKGGSSLTDVKRQKQTIKVKVGWMHYKYSQHKYIQVRGDSTTGGTYEIILQSDENYESVLNKATKLFFPHGKSKKGRLNGMETHLGTSKGEMIRRDECTVGERYLACQTQKLRLYLLTKAKISVLTDSSSSHELPDCSFLNVTGNAQEADGSQLQSGFSQLPNIQTASLVVPASSVSGEGLLGQSHDTYTASTPSEMGNLQMAVLQTQQLAASSSSVNSRNPPAQSHPESPQASSSACQHGQQPGFVNAGTPTVQFKTDHTYTKHCTICYEREKDAFFLPCGHPTCLVCGLQVQGMGQKCPVCRVAISHVQSLYE